MGGERDISRNEFLCLARSLQDVRMEERQKRREESERNRPNLDKIDFPLFLLLLLKLSFLFGLSSGYLHPPSSPSEALELTLRYLLLPRSLNLRGLVFLPFTHERKASRRTGKVSGRQLSSSPPPGSSAPPSRPQSAPPKPDKVIASSARTGVTGRQAGDQFLRRNRPKGQHEEEGGWWRGGGRRREGVIKLPSTVSSMKPPRPRASRALFIWRFPC
eukprot:754594-Hanusia_phi.AAC.6